MAAGSETYQGTVVPREKFGENETAEAAKVLRKAMKGFGTNEQAMIDVLCSHTNQQLMKIYFSYKTQFKKDLLADVKDDLSGDFEKLVVALLKETCQFDSECLKHAMEGIGTDEDLLMEILCTRTNKDITEIKKKYHSLYYANVEDDVSRDTSGNFKKVLKGLCTGTRDEGKEVNKEQAKKDAQALFDAGEKRLGTDESVFNTLFVSKNFHYLRQVFDDYKEIAGKDITESIKTETSGDYQDVLLNLVTIVRNRPEYFADKLYKSMKGLGTNDEALIRIVVSRCEVDMVQIKEEFEKKYNQSLADWIRDDTSGNYRRLLLRLIGLSAQENANTLSHLLDNGSMSESLIEITIRFKSSDQSGADHKPILTMRIMD